ncbi:MAG: hypothetical protein EOM53_05730 [Alphaproteobacteria bacterium]|nr:hypothetical protein [Alphaproteobacteria bacterium]
MRNLKYIHLSTDELLSIESVADFHNPELIAEICRRAGLAKEFEMSNGETFEAVLAKAVEILKSRDAMDV